VLEHLDIAVYADSESSRTIQRRMFPKPRKISGACGVQRVNCPAQLEAPRPSGPYPAQEQPQWQNLPIDGRYEGRENFAKKQNQFPRRAKQQPFKHAPKVQEVVSVRGSQDLGVK